MTEPDVCVPAVLRSYHEVLRNDLARVLVPLADTGDLDGFAAAWQAHTRASAVHAAMENGVPGAGGGSAATLDHCFGGAAVATRVAAGQGHRQALQAALHAALPLGLAALRPALAAYRQAALAHLRHKEDTMMPLLARLPAPLPPITPAVPTPRAA